MHKCLLFVLLAFCHGVHFKLIIPICQILYQFLVICNVQFTQKNLIFKKQKNYRYKHLKTQLFSGYTPFVTFYVIVNQKLRNYYICLIFCAIYTKNAHHFYRYVVYDPFEALHKVKNCNIFDSITKYQEFCQKTATKYAIFLDFAY